MFKKNPVIDRKENPTEPLSENEPIDPTAVIVPIGVLTDTPAEQREEAPEILTSVDAFNTMLDKTVVHALRKEYHPSMNIIQAIMDGIYHEGKFNYKSFGLLIGAMAIGGIGSVYAVQPAGAGAHILVDFIQRKTGVKIPASDVLVLVVKGANTAEVALVATLSGKRLLQTYLVRASREVRFLVYKETTKADVLKKISRKTFDLACAMAANVPTFLLSRQMGIPLAVLSAIANVSISWMGSSQLPISLPRMHPARRAELTYLHDQLETFLRLSFDTQNQILDKLAVLCRDGISANGATSRGRKQFYARLLNLTKYHHADEKPEETVVQAREKRQYKEIAAASGFATLTIMSQLAWVEAAGVGVARLFPEPKSPEAIITGVSMALLALLPGFGYGYSSGSNAGRAMVTHNEALARLHHPYIREALKWLINAISVFAGSTLFSLAYDGMTDATTLIHMQGVLKEIFRMSISGLVYIGGATSNGYYTLVLLDEILIYFAQRCGNEKIQRLYAFVLETRGMQKVLTEMGKKSYLELLKWKMQVDPEDNDDELSRLMHGIFDDRLDEGQYKRLQQELNSDSLVVKDRDALPHTYTRIASFYDQYENKDRRQGLRRRMCHGLFSSCAKKSANIEPGVSIEMHPRV